MTAFPGRGARSFAARMTQLNADRNRRIGTNIFQHRAQSRFGIVVPQAKVARGNAANRLNRGGLNNQQARPGKRQLPKMDAMPCGGLAFAGGILTHRRNNNAVFQCQLANMRCAKELTHEYLISL